MDDNRDSVPPPASEAVSSIELTPKQIVIIILAVIVVVIVVGAILYGLVTHPLLTGRLRDISIIVLALVTVVIGLFLTVLIFQLQSLIVVLRDEIKPLLDSANQTADTVRGTTVFLSDAVVTPLINAASYVSAVRASFGVIRSGRRRSDQTDPHDGG